MNAQSARQPRHPSADWAARLLACSSLACVGLAAQQPPQPTDLPAHPFFIKQDWIIGGTGPWDYLTVDPTAQRLFIAHGHAVQAVDIVSGQLVGSITGLVDAHSIALDDTGQFGYISDGPAARVIVFDRRSLEKVASIESNPNPRALVFEPQTKLLFVIRTDPGPAAPAPTRSSQTKTLPVYRPAPQHQPPPDLHASSSITIIDTLTQTALGQVLISGTLGFAQSDGRGQVYVSATDRNEIVRIDAQSVSDLMRKPDDGTAAAPPAGTPRPNPKPITLDWTDARNPVQIKALPLADCASPKGLAIDGAHSRLFATCSGRRMVVINADTGERVATLPTGDGVEAIGYDPNHGLIYTANGGADGSLTIISQSVADTYAVIQNLVTRQRARTLAVNPESGQVFLVTDLLGVNLAAPAGAQFTLHTNSVDGSFQVLVVGN